MLWPLRRCALRVINHRAQADARTAVRAHAFTVKKDTIRKVSGALIELLFKFAPSNHD